MRRRRRLPDAHARSCDDGDVRFNVPQGPAERRDRDTRCPVMPLPRPLLRPLATMHENRLLCGIMAGDQRPLLDGDVAGVSRWNPEEL
jgi:hypothetical protein